MTRATGPCEHYALMFYLLRYVELYLLLSGSIKSWIESRSSARGLLQ